MVAVVPDSGAALVFQQLSDRDAFGRGAFHVHRAWVVILPDRRSIAIFILVRLQWRQRRLWLRLSPGLRCPVARQHLGAEDARERGDGQPEAGELGPGRVRFDECDSVPFIFPEVFKDILVSVIVSDTREENPPTLLVLVIVVEYS